MPALQTHGIERYQLGEELGRGGLGVVRVARDTSLQRDVAIKSIQRASERAVLSFVEEAQITGQLEHPNIVPVHEIGLDAGGRPYLSMKRVQGRTLREVIAAAHAERQTRPASWPAAEQRLLDIVLKVCDAIAYAHSRGVIHRDLKPDNIMVGDFGEVLVMDWGLARPLSRVADGDDTTASATRPPATEPTVVSDRRADSPDLTRDGAVIGTPAYMAPEQAAGRVREINERADIYALGAMLYTVEVGQPPLSGMNRQHVQQILADVIAGRFPSPRAASDGRVARELDAIIRKAMALDPADRYASAQQLQADIAAWRAFQSTTARRAGPLERVVRWTRRHPKITLATGLIGAAAFIVTVLLFQLQARDQAARLAESERARAESDRALAESDRQRALAELRVQEEVARTQRERAETAEESRESLESRIEEMLDKTSLEAIRAFRKKFEEAERRGARAEQFTSSMTREEIARTLHAFDTMFALYEDLEATPAATHWINRGTLRQVTGDLDGAIADYDQGLKITPNDAATICNRGLARATAGDRDGALADFNEALRIDPTSASALANRAILHSDAGRFDDAINDATAALEANPGYVAALICRGSALNCLGRNEAALADFEEVIRIAPGNALGFNGRGFTRQSMGNYDGALADYTEACRLNPGDKALMVNLGAAHELLGNAAAALEQYNAVLAVDPDYPSALLGRGNVRMAAGDLDGALTDYNRVLEINPDDPWTLCYRGYVLMESDPQAALRDFNRALEGRNHEVVLMVDLLVNRGCTRQSLKDLEGALEDYNRALELDPDYTSAIYNRGSAYLEQRNPAAALRDFTRVTELDPENWLADVNRGYAFQDLGRLEEAIAAWTRAWHRCPVEDREWIGEQLERVGADVPDDDR